MSFPAILDAVSVRAPIIIGGSVVAAIAGAWSDAPHWPFYGLAIALLPLAVALWGRKAVPRLLKSREQLGFRRNRDLLGFEFFGKGTPRGHVALTLVSWLAIVLTGFRFPYAAVAIAGMILTVAWAEDRRRYPSEDINER